MNVDLGTAIDSSRYEMIYQIVARDPAIGEEQFQTRILQFGNSAIKDSGYRYFRIDSVLWIRNEPTITMWDTQLIASSYGNIPGSTDGTEYLYQDGKWRITNVIGPEGCMTYDTTANQEWELLDDTAVVAGFECNKARTKFRGREWIVWYAPEIPYQAGPWKLGGLPGLILKAESADGEYSMQAVLLRNSNDLIVRNRDKYKELKRDEFARKHKDTHEYPFRRYEFNINGRHERYDERGFYNPIEKTLD